MRIESIQLPPWKKRLIEQGLEFYIHIKKDDKIFATIATCITDSDFGFTYPYIYFYRQNAPVRWKLENNLRNIEDAIYVAGIFFNRNEDYEEFETIDISEIDEIFNSEYREETIH